MTFDTDISLNSQHSLLSSAAKVGSFVLYTYGRRASLDYIDGDLSDFHLSTAGVISDSV